MRLLLAALDRVARWLFVPERAERNYPGAEMSYELARDSYDLMLRQYEFTHQRVEYLATIAVSLGIGVPAVVAERGATLSFSSGYLAGAGICVALAIALVVVMRVVGGFVLVSPETLYAQWMHLEREAFQAQYTYWAGQHFKQNARAIYWKSMAGVAVAILIVVEAAFLALWLAAER